MTDMERRTAAKQFAADWQGRGDEKQETQAFWMALLQKVFGVAEPDKYIEFEVRVKLSHTSFIDGLIKDTRVLIEQKGQDIDLRKGYKQSDGSMLTPYQQARRYAGYLPHDLNPRWIVVCNFKEFHIHDMNRPNDAPEVVLLSDLEKEYSRLNFLVDTGDENIKREMEISMQAGELVGKLYDAFMKQYKDPTNERTLKSLNMLCVRLVFCLYAEDAGIFGRNNMFHDYLRNRGMQNGRRALRDLFRVLDQKLEDRDPYLSDDDPDLAAFPYVNGGLFSDEDIEIPPFNDEIYNLLLTRASEDFNWSDIMGNPPFVGKSYQTAEQKEDMKLVFGSIKNYGNLDYVACWYKKAADLIESSEIQCAFVSTNSVCQGIAVPPLWNYLLREKNSHITFAHQTFRWDSEANQKAHVHCVIIGLGNADIPKKKRLYSSGIKQFVPNINAYLLNAPNVIIEDIHDPLCSVPKMAVGSFPTDGGYLVIQADEYDDFLKSELLAAKYVREYIGPMELINAKKRYCLWLKDCSPKELRQMSKALERIQNVREYRSKSTKAQTRNRANIPHLFAEDRQPTSSYIMIPRTSSEQRRYMPMGFFTADVIAGDTIILPDATVYHFGILTSNVHMAWMRAVCGRMKSDYRYSNTIVYNNFPWPAPTDAQKAKIEQTAQAILDARALYPDCSLADLYDEVTMPPELRKAHQQNDKAVMDAYGFWGKLNTEADCVAALMEMYAEMTK